MRNATVTVRLSRRMLDALDAVVDGYNVDPCHDPHPHAGQACDGWSPAEIRSLDAASTRLQTASRRADRLSR